MAQSQKRFIDFSGAALLGWEPDEPVLVCEIVYLIYWTTPGNEQFGHKSHFDVMASGGLMNQLCRIDEQDIPF